MPDMKAVDYAPYHTPDRPDKLTATEARKINAPLFERAAKKEWATAITKCEHCGGVSEIKYHEHRGLAHSVKCPRRDCGMVIQL